MLDWIFRVTSTNNHVNIYELNNLPLCKASEEQKKSITSLVRQIMDLKETDNNADTSADERAIDLLVYKLYGLAYDEVKIVDPETDITEEEYNS